MKISTIAELQKIVLQENQEPLVELSPTLFVRQTVAEKLQKIKNRLKYLSIVEGYRTPRYQEHYFLNRLLVEYQQNPNLAFNQLLEQTHSCVALPSVAGHPTGGAVDVTLADADMGGEVADFSHLELLPTYSPLTTEKQRHNRLKLHDAMVAEGFAPFYGEWWHFSYGDAEWAAFYAKSASLYSPLYR